jgi:hypothetical protein
VVGGVVGGRVLGGRVVATGGRVVAVGRRVVAVLRRVVGVVSMTAGAAVVVVVAPTIVVDVVDVELLDVVVTIDVVLRSNDWPSSPPPPRLMTTPATMPRTMAKRAPQ